VTSSIADLVLWSTGRRSWREVDVRLEGDVHAGARFCDAVHVF
jgi:hypothetical protein